MPSSTTKRESKKSRRGRKGPSLDVLKPELMSTSFGPGWVTPPSSPTKYDYPDDGAGECSDVEGTTDADEFGVSMSIESSTSIGLLSPGSSSACSSELESSRSKRRKSKKKKKSKKKASRLNVLKPELSSTSFGTGWVSPRSSMVNFDRDNDYESAAADIDSSFSTTRSSLSESSFDLESASYYQEQRRTTISEEDEKASDAELFAPSFGSGWASSISSISYDYFNEEVEETSTIDFDSSISTRSSMMFADSELESISHGQRSSSVASGKRRTSVRFAAEVNLRRKGIRDNLLEAQRPTRPRHRTLSVPPSILRQSHHEIPQLVCNDYEEGEPTDWLPRFPTLLLY